MEKLNKQNFILQGPLDKVIFKISTPLMLNNLVMTLYNLTDGLFVAQLSAEDFAATAFVWPLHFLFISIGMGLGIGSTALVSQYIGADKDDIAEHYANNTLMIINILGLLVAIIGFLLTPTMLAWMGARGSLLEKSTIYLRINFIGIFFDFIYFAYQAVLNAQGLTQYITKISVISSLTNVVLDPIFIFKTIPVIHIPGLGMGIAGAAIATVISKIVLYVLAIIIVNKESRIPLSLRKNKFDWAVIRRIFKISIPSALGYSGSALGFTILNGLITSYGTTTLAAYSMVNRVTDLFTQPQMGIGGAMTSIIGQHMGAHKFQRAKDIFRRAIFIVIIMSLIASVVTILFKDPILEVFIKDGADIDLKIQATEYLYFSAVIIFFMGLFSILNGFFQGTGQTQYSMFMTMGRLWLLRLPLIWFLSTFTELGSTGIWISMLLSNMFIVIIGFIIYKKKDWAYLATY